MIRLLLASSLLCGLCACRNPPPGQSDEASSGQRREAAYRANNRGVALMEQGSYADAARAFREALMTEPGLRLPRINLPIALYYDGQLDEAKRAADDARRDAPDAPQPVYMLGLIARAQNAPDAAADAFTRALMLDPSDVGAKLNLAMVHLQQGRYQDTVALCREVLAAEAYNATAAYNLALALDRGGDRAASARAMQQFQALRTAPYALTYSQAYLEQGRYAEALASSGAEPDLVDQTAPRVTLTDATSALLPGSPAARVIALGDLDGDSRLDLITGDESLRLFRNNGAQLVDATALLANVDVRGVTGIAVADVNNDGRLDLLVLTESGAHLITQQSDGQFRDTTPAVFRAAPARLAAALADIDHDGDLDVVTGGRLLRNNGNGAFTDVTAAARLRLPAAATTILPTDFDNRRDVDLFAITLGTRPVLFRNLRTGTFEDVAIAAGLPSATDITAAAIGDVNNDGFTDFFFGRAAAPGLWAMNDGRGRFQLRDASAETKGTLAAQLFDYDNDGLIDLIIAARDGLHLFRNRARDWQRVDETVAATRHTAAATDVAPSLASGDLDSDGDLDLVAADSSGSLRIWRNDGGTRHRALRVALAGRASNRGGIGAKVEIRAGSLYGRVETTATTPAAIPARLTFGLGTRAQADAVRVLWPSGILQTETPPVGSARIALAELDRKPSSCPFLYTWNGDTFTFVTDFMGGGEMGYLESPGVYNVADPDEYVRITNEQLRERNGRYDLRVTNELEEVLYVDQLKLMAVTHYADVEVFPNEGMRVHPAPYQLFAVRNVRPLASAVDDAGHSLLPELAAVDRKFAAGFPLEPIRGYAKAHAVTMRLPSRAPRTDARTVLLLTGWTDYAFSTNNIAGSQSGLTLAAPV